MKYFVLAMAMALAPFAASANDVDKAKRVAFGESPAPAYVDMHPNAGRGGADAEDTDASDALGGNG